ncbi:GntR family transcriptional regulator [Mesoplasma syrphidae]|uniref:GntR family transcriptional regulator n=1 Tax=Mesoplasma syrphidae TaxID=225999 RepID=A0A2K9BV14_9MOLU|nr:GntR family transcriptional regulator [Mesoplasma syrphidae]AUF83560.1 GntR family transcriptional regulator [Mesoplasma syrphidae]
MTLSKEIFNLILLEVKSKQAGSQLLSEQAYAKKYYTTRQTIRGALKALESQNIIYSVKGKGYFVNSKILWKRLIPFSIKHQSTTSQILKKDIELDKYFVGNFLTCKNDFKSLIKLRYIKNNIHKYSIVWINTKIVGTLDYQEIKNSVLVFLEKRQVLAKSYTKIILLKANDIDSKILGIKPIEYVPCRYSVLINDYNEVIQCSIEKYVPDQFDLNSKEVF